MKTVSFVAACSNSGKTTLIEKVVKLLKARGLRVAVVKHAPKGFELDKPGKDSWRFQQAGADSVVLLGPGKMALMQNIDRELSPEEIEQSLQADIMICEGFKNTFKNKIEVFRNGVSGERPLCITDPTYLALVSDRYFAVGIPRFDLNDTEAITEFILKKILSEA